MGNILMDGNTAVLWHQWYGSYRTRLAGPTVDRNVFKPAELVALETLAKEGEAAFLADYPALDLSSMMPAWGPDWDVVAEQEAAEAASPGLLVRASDRLRWWRSLGWRGLAVRAYNKVDRWRRLWRTS